MASLSGADRKYRQPVGWGRGGAWQEVSCTIIGLMRRGLGFTEDMPEVVVFQEASQRHKAKNRWWHGKEACLRQEVLHSQMEPVSQLMWGFC